ncbi:MAG: hypothetical protein WAO35_16260 [Terriglobia bacterium]
MADSPLAIYNQYIEANPQAFDQPYSSVHNSGNYIWSGIDSFRGTYPFEAMALIYSNDPFLFSRLIKLFIESLQKNLDVSIVSLKENIRSLVSEVQELRVEIQQLRKERTFVIPLTTLAPQPFQMTLQIPATIDGDGEDYTATFMEANVSASGESEADAIANFKDMLVSTYKTLEEIPAQELGPLPSRQWAILKSVVKRSE